MVPRGPDLGFPMAIMDWSLVYCEKFGFWTQRVSNHGPPRVLDLSCRSGYKPAYQVFLNPLWHGLYLCLQLC
jgi:hypothetical protein